MPLAPAQPQGGNGQQSGEAEGILEIVDEGFGFLRVNGVMPSNEDIYVSTSQVRRFGLRTGDCVTGQTRPPKDQEKYWGMLRVDTVNGVEPEVAKRRPYFDSLVPVFPDEMFDLETDQKNLTQRLINLISPIGKGQRGLILSPAKAGKTTVLKQIAAGITENHPRRTSWSPSSASGRRRSPTCSAASTARSTRRTFDEPTENHTRVAEMCLEIAKRQVETGRDVVILLDSITRLARAYNLALPASGKTLSGGVDPVALYPPKRFFGAARNIEHGGSLTIIATCLVDTGSRMDDVIYEEFKGTGNMELALDRKLQREAHLPGHRRPALRHPPRGAAPRRELAADGVDHAPHAQRGRPERGDRAAHAAARQDEEQRRVPRLAHQDRRGLRALLSPIPALPVIAVGSPPRPAARRAAASAVRPPAAPSRSASLASRIGARRRRPSARAASRPAGEVEPAPGSDSAVYAPNPGAIVVAIDAGHGGCLDWGVPDPSERGVELAEKTMTLGMRRALRDRLEADGITVVMIRDGDDALAGDNYPELGCDGPAWRDVNGDGEAGFDPEGGQPGPATSSRPDSTSPTCPAPMPSSASTSTRRSTAGSASRSPSARPSTPMRRPGAATPPSGWRAAIQDGVVAALAAIADYERGDRGITAHNFYLVAPTLFEPTPERPDPLRQPTRGALMPTVLAEVGSITLRAEHDLLGVRRRARRPSPTACSPVSSTTSRQRAIAARIGLEDAARRAAAGGRARRRPALLGTGGARRPGSACASPTPATTPIAAGRELVAGWGRSDQPYLAARASGAERPRRAMPALEPGESVVVEVDLPVAAGRAGLAWISLLMDGTTLADLGSPALQLASGAP